MSDFIVDLDNADALRAKILIMEVSTELYQLFHASFTSPT